jgi:DNA polymerase I
MKKLLLIDGMSSAYRAFYAIRGLTTSRGLPTNAVFGFIQILRKVLAEYQPDFVAVAGDVKGPTFRHELYKEYKMHRKPMDPDLSIQIPLIKRVAEGYRIPWLELPGYEADDILAWLAIKARDRGIKTYILTGDKDMMQLVGEMIHVISPHKDSKIYDAAAVEEHYGIPPSKVGDLLALMGDSSDNVPGVPGVGPKTAVKLLKEYHTLEGVLDHAGEVKNRRVRENLATYADQARFSRRLVELETDLPLEWKLEDLQASEPDLEQLRELFGEFEFKNLLREVLPDDSPRIATRRVEDTASCRVLVDDLTRAGEFALQLRSDGFGFMEAKPTALAVSYKEGEAVYIDLTDEVFREKIFSVLRPVLEREDIEKIAHDAKFLTHMLSNVGIRIKGICWDNMLASYLIHPSRPDHDLGMLAWEFLNHAIVPPPEQERDLFDTGETESVLCEEAAADFALKSILEKKLKEGELLELLRNMELPLSAILAEMERNGLRLDRGQFGQLSLTIEEELSSLVEKIYELAGEEFNLNSPKQLRRILFEKLGLPPKKKTKTGYSTDVAVLSQLSEEHELPGLILKYRGLFKLKSTYLDPLPSMINPATGRIHTTFQQAVTATGRLSSITPNLQNIPIRGELGREVRRAFVPGQPGWRFLAADYSQIDLRVMAHLSEDPLLLEAFRNNEDIHSFTASLIFNLSPDEITTEMRRKAKTVNFGIIYGMGAFGLSQNLKISFQEADAFIKAYFDKYSGVAKYISRTIEEAKELGYVTTLFNRRRYLPELNSDQDNVRRFGERTAVNTPIQGTSSDIIKLAMIEVSGKLRREGFESRLLLQVHDDLLFESPEEELPRLSKMVSDAMEGVVTLSVPLRVDIKEGDNWGDMGRYIDVKDR